MIALVSLTNQVVGYGVPGYRMLARWNRGRTDGCRHRNGPHYHRRRSSQSTDTAEAALSCGINQECPHDERSRGASSHTKRGRRGCRQEEEPEAVYRGVAAIRPQ